MIVEGEEGLYKVDVPTETVTKIPNLYDMGGALFADADGQFYTLGENSDDLIFDEKDGSFRFAEGGDEKMTLYRLSKKEDAGGAEVYHWAAEVILPTLFGAEKVKGEPAEGYGMDAVWFDGQLFYLLESHYEFENEPELHVYDPKTGESSFVRTVGKPFEQLSLMSWDGGMAIINRDNMKAMVLYDAETKKFENRNLTFNQNNIRQAAFDEKTKTYYAIAWQGTGLKGRSEIYAGAAPNRMKKVADFPVLGGLHIHNGEALFVNHGLRSIQQNIKNVKFGLNTLNYTTVYNSAFTKATGIPVYTWDGYKGKDVLE